MNNTETMVEERDLYLLGVLAKGVHEHANGMVRFPRGCDEADTLLQAGYLVSISYGTAGVRYEFTPQRQDAGEAYRFNYQGRV